MFLIKSGYVIDPRSGVEGVRDILADRGKIVRIAAKIREEDLEGEEGGNFRLAEEEGNNRGNIKAPEA
ncbi:MAG: hypothetical protein OSJ44_15535, partial [Lachnospiraceae bacterium]|nr:hypothetical protein [Lachnospiraceae bacterium]